MTREAGAAVGLPWARVGRRSLAVEGKRRDKGRYETVLEDNQATFGAS